jgi:hypothetical protein
MFLEIFKTQNTHSLSASFKSSQNEITADSRFGFPQNTGNEQSGFRVGSLTDSLIL